MYALLTDSKQRKELKEVLKESKTLTMGKRWLYINRVINKTNFTLLKGLKLVTGGYLSRDLPEDIRKNFPHLAIAMKPSTKLFCKYSELEDVPTDMMDVLTDKEQKAVQKVITAGIEAEALPNPTDPVEPTPKMQAQLALWDDFTDKLETLGVTIDTGDIKAIKNHYKIVIGIYKELRKDA